MNETVFSYDIKTNTYSEIKWTLFTRNGKEIKPESVLDGDEIRLRVDFKNVYEEEWKPCVAALAVYLDGELTDVVTEKIRIFPFIPELYLTTDFVKINSNGKKITFKGYFWESNLFPDELVNFLLLKTAKPEYKKLKVDVSALAPCEEDKISNPSPYFTGYDDARRFFADTVCFVSDNRYIYANNRKYKTEQRPIYFDGQIWGERETVEKIFGTWDFTEEKLINGKKYIPLKSSIEQMGYCVSESYRGLVVIADRPYDISEENNAEFVKDMLRYIIFERPSRERIKQIVQNTKHPFVLVSKEKLDEMLKNKTPHVKQMTESILHQAKVGLDTPVAVEMKGIPAHEGVEYHEVLKLYWAYRVTGDRRFADKAIAHAMAMANWPHWKSSGYFLQTAFCLMTCGYVYDLLYDELTDEQRKTLCKAIAEKGIKPASEHYYGKGVSNWPLRPNNWNVVCNAGTIVGALAICNDYESNLCFDTIEKAIASFEYALLSYAPNGGWFEGSAYSCYTSIYLALATHALQCAFDTDFGLIDVPGRLNHAYFPFYMTGNDGNFNLHDNIFGMSINAVASMWVAKYTRDRNLRDLRLEQIKYLNKNVATFLDLIWCPGDDECEERSIPLDMNYGFAEMATSRSGWDSEATFIGLHAGDNSCEHGHADIGEFELEMYGIKFALDMGREDYGLTGYHYFNTRRNDYYVNRAEGHNVYVINPSAFPGQYHYAEAKIKTEAETADGVIYTIDMTPAYLEQLQHAKRGVMLKNNRRVFVVQDEIVPNNMTDEYYWFWHTDAEIEITDSSHVKLHKNGKTLDLYFSSNVEFEISKGLTEPLKTTPITEDYDKQMKMYGKKNKITVKFISNADKVLFRAMAIPDNIKYDSEEIVPIADWTLAETATELMPQKQMTDNSGKVFTEIGNDEYEHAKKEVVNGECVSEFVKKFMPIADTKIQLELDFTVTGENAELSITSAFNDKEIELIKIGKDQVVYVFGYVLSYYEIGKVNSIKLRFTPGISNEFEFECNGEVLAKFHKNDIYRVPIMDIKITERVDENKEASIKVDNIVLKGI